MRANTAHRRIFVLLVAWASVLAVAAPAHAATRPQLTSPEAGASFVEGGRIDFKWTGALQGDDTAMDRSSFRVEIARDAQVPADPQAAWTQLSTFFVTPAGQQANAAAVGVEQAGSYRWRVCAWGVVDDTQSQTLEQLPGGCSDARAFSTKAGTLSDSTPGQVTVTEKSTVATPGQVIRRTNPVAPVAAATPKTIKKQVKVPPASAPQVEARFDTGRVGSGGGGDRTSFGTGGRGSSSVGNVGGRDVFSGGAAADAGGGGAAENVSRALSASLPGVPIPFWALGLLALSLPVAWWWKRSTLAMFDWPGGASMETAGTGRHGYPGVKGSASAADADDAEAQAFVDDGETSRQWTAA